MREALPTRRASWTQKAVVGGHTFFVTFGEYPDGRLGEVFVTCAKQGTFLRGVMDSLARTISVALQCGASVADIAKTLRGMDFPPNGEVKAQGSEATVASSFVDYLAQELEMSYQGRVAGKHTTGSGV